MTFEFTVHPTFNFLKSFAEKLNVAVQNNKVVLPPSLGQGYVRKIDIEADLRFVMHHYTLKQPLRLKRIPPDEKSDLISIVFNSHEIPSKPSVDQDKAIQYLQAHGSAIQIASSSLGTESMFPSGSKVFYAVVGIKTDLLVDFLQMGKPNNLFKTILNGNINFFFHESMFPEAHRILQQLSEIKEENKLFHLYYRVKVLELVYLLFEKLLLRESIHHSAVNKADLEKLYEIKAGLVADLSIQPRISELAKKAGMSPTKMKQLFRQVFGDTIYNYYQKVRMEEAAFLLKHGGHSVSEVGYKLGFSNLSHFGRVFEKHYGVKPKRYTLVF